MKYDVYMYTRGGSRIFEKVEGGGVQTYEAPRNAHFGPAVPGMID